MYLNKIFKVPIDYMLKTHYPKFLSLEIKT